MSRNLTLDILKIFLACMVVAIHGQFLKETNLVASELLVNGVFRIAVPIFLIASGFYFVNVINSPISWFRRLLVLYFFWLFLYSYYWINSTDSFLGYLATIIIGYHHLWYLPAMCIAGFLLYLMRNKSLLLLSLYVFSLYFLGLLIQYGLELKLFTFLPNTILEVLNKQSLILSRNFLFFAFPFFTLGYLINKYDLINKISTKRVTLIIVCSLLGLLFESFMNLKFLPHMDKDLLIFLIILCPSIFVLCLKIDTHYEIKNIAFISSSIYFIHPALLNLLPSFINLSLSYIVVLACALAGLVGCLLIRLRPKVTFLKYIF